MRAGFARPSDFRLPYCQRRAMVAQLIATVALVVSIAVATAAVSIGIVRADTLTAGDGARLATTALLVLFLAGMGGLAARARQDAKVGAKRRD